MEKNICVLGSGSWGTALAILLSKKGNKVTMWSWLQKEVDALRTFKENKEFLPGVPIPDGIELTTDIEMAVKGKEIIIMAVPSHAVRQTSRNIQQFFTKGQIIVNVSKGLEEGSLLRMSQVILEELPGSSVCALSGPTHAEEVSRCIPSTIVAASVQENVSKYVQDIFMNENLRVYTNSDLVGVEIGGALKNVIALCAGISDGLGFGDNTKAALMTRGITEMTRLGVKMGADSQTFAGLTGIGDLIVTCTSMHSRNRRAGILIGKGYSLSDALKEVHMVVEGVTTAKAAHYMSEKYGVDMPITNEAYSVLFEGKIAKDAVMNLMTRNKTFEKNIN